MIKSTKHILYCTLLIILLAAQISCRGGVDPVVKIGLVAPFDGEQRAVGYDVIYSARLAVREINQQGGIRGHRVALVAYDDSSFAPEAEAVAEALVIDQAVVGVIGHWGETTTSAGQTLYAESGMPFVPMGGNRFGSYDPSALNPEFAQAYQAITYQGAQAPGIHAGTTYDAMQLLFAAIDQAVQADGAPTRSAVLTALPQVEIDGLTGAAKLP